jgi:hypothetical protein
VQKFSCIHVARARPLEGAGHGSHVPRDNRNSVHVALADGSDGAAAGLGTAIAHALKMTDDTHEAS